MEDAITYNQNPGFQFESNRSGKNSPKKVHLRSHRDVRIQSCSPAKRAQNLLRPQAKSDPNLTLLDVVRMTNALQAFKTNAEKKKNARIVTHNK